MEVDCIKSVATASSSQICQPKDFFYLGWTSCWNSLLPQIPRSRIRLLWLMFPESSCWKKMQQKTSHVANVDDGRSSLRFTTAKKAKRNVRARSSLVLPFFITDAHSCQRYLVPNDCSASILLFTVDNLTPERLSRLKGERGHVAEKHRKKGRNSDTVDVSEWKSLCKQTTASIMLSEIGKSVAGPDLRRTMSRTRRRDSKEWWKETCKKGNRSIFKEERGVLEWRYPCIFLEESGRQGQQGGWWRKLIVLFPLRNRKRNA